ncbi:hypothetical protein ASD15_29065 [Massilia sp. Root351]|uniref:hypothetical protein n=1 Tax=Massilia sp. Root351 TaxID=1736522 RepID=UPI000708C9E0|nr:hypothetical protein [Massilia sp. Root351]KQV86643.1 hypothetical protein ASD15_29065 [Massilia sp. Root351]
MGSFIGARAGWAKVDLPELGFTGGCSCFGPAKESGWGWQLRAGLAYRVAQQHRVSLQYTYLSLPGASRGAEPSVTYRRERFGALGVGYAYAF